MNKIWIELNKADTFEEAQAQCDLANKMLKRLGLEHDTFVASNHQRYTGTFYNHQVSNGSYTELDDRGQWFNLDYLANEVPVEKLTSEEIKEFREKYHETR